MLELFPEGFEELDRDGDVELAAYTGSGGEERLWQAFGPGRGAPVAADWRDAWKRFHRPVRVGPLWIGPPWEKADAGSTPVVIDPGRAFGTGSHATTRLSLELLLTLEPGSLLDVGSGSGVLAIAAAKLGFAPVTALDHDAAAVETAWANARTNGVTFDIQKADALTGHLPEADVTVANVTLEAAEKLVSRVRSRVFVVSGYVARERPTAPGWRRAARRESGGWAADLLVRG
jgi:ribosomal protein L11 methyltransferase